MAFGLISLDLNRCMDHYGKNLSDTDLILSGRLPDCSQHHLVR